MDILRHFPSLGWRDLGKSQKTLDRIASLQTANLVYVRQDCNHLTAAVI